MDWWRVVLGAYAAVNVVAFLAYAWDTRRAQRGARRVPENRLHMLPLLGGFVGAALGMHLMRHKTKKPLFGLVILLGAVLHATVWGLVVWA